MIQVFRVLGTLAAIGCIVIARGPARGGDVVVDQEPDGRRPEQQFVTDLGKAFDSQVFGGLVLHRAVGDAAKSAAPEEVIAERLASLRPRADARIATVDRIVGLSEEQRKKLQIAAQSDLRRLVDAVSETRAKYAGRSSTIDPRTGRFDEAEELQRDAQRCRQLVQAAFGPESLLAKVVVGTLDADQARKYAAVMEGRAACRWKAIVASGLAALEDRWMLGCTQKQHDAVAAVLLSDPPTAVEDDLWSGAAMPPAMVVAGRLAALGDEKLASLLDPRQRRLVAEVSRLSVPNFVGPRGLVRMRMLGAGEVQIGQE